ncbi:transporter MotA/TolQ/ExbB proton channel family protein [Perkinsela sp. CCAP 1560/4]|nr:transporter MotA/TolQ/ExbB proton channel family protein [Perkinsela sp. CCAP 1560/4]|eukprot:KNH09463.1 transporter MotA/TolQ/ExbB proton channel family protein [Perkinsela sp. CCAP 1560/4]
MFGGTSAAPQQNVFSLGGQAGRPSTFMPSIGSSMGNNTFGMPGAPGAGGTFGTTPFGAGMAGGLFPPSNQAPTQAKVVSRDTFAAESKLIIKKQDESFQNHLKASSNPQSNLETLEGCSLGRIIAELTKKAEANEGTFQDLLKDVRSHDEANRKINRMVKSATVSIDAIKRLHESFTRKKESLLCLFSTIESGLEALKKEVEPIFSPFFRSDVMVLVREDSGTDNFFHTKMHAESNIGSAACANVNATRAKKRWEILGSLEAIFSEVYTLVAKVGKLTNSGDESSDSTYFSESQKATSKTVRRIVQDNFLALSTVWQQIMRLNERRNEVEKLMKKKEMLI